MNVDKSSARVQQMFGEISGRYDFLNHFLSLGVDYSWRRKTTRSVPTDLEGPILDVCTGTGDLAIAFWKKYRGRVQVIGSDFTHEMLDIANAKRDRKQIPAVPAVPGERESLSFVEADTQHLPFEENSFEAVSVAFGLRNVTDTKRGVREMLRVAKPGGQVLILEFGMPRNKFFGACYRWYFKHVLPRLGQLLARNRQSAYNYLPQSVSEFPYGEKLVALLEECGMQRVTYRPLTLGVAGLYIGYKSAAPQSEVPMSDETTTPEEVSAT